MPYIGNSHNNVGEHVNNFKVLDDISSYTATFDGSATGVVSTTNETIRVADHRFLQGQRVTYNNGGGSNIGGLTSGTAYYISLDTANTVKLATSLVNANNNTVINLSSVGSGSSHTLTAAFDGVNKEFKLTYGTKAAIVLTAPQLNIAINNVIQRPNLNPLSFTEGFAVKDGNKIIFQSAPQVNDVFWGSITSNSISVFDVEDNAVDNFTGDGSTTNFTLSAIPPNKESILVTLDGVVQHPSDNSTTRAYTIDASVVVFTSAPASGVLIQVRHIGFASPTTPVRSFYGRTGNVTLNNTDDIVTRNINSSGIITASSFSGSFSGAISGTTISATSANFSGDVSIGGTLTYEDVKNVDSVGFITARSGILVQDDATFTGAVGNMVFDKSDSALEFGDNVKAKFGSGNRFSIYENGTSAIIDNTYGSGSILRLGSGNQVVLGSPLSNNQTLIRGVVNGPAELYHAGAKKLETYSSGINVTGNTVADGLVIDGDSDLNGDLDVDGHTNLDNVNVGGATTTTGVIVINAGTQSTNTTSGALRVAGGAGIQGNVNVGGDLDVDGHTNLDNVSVAGVTTFTGNSQFDDYIRIGNPAQLGSGTGSQIGRGASGTRPASLTFNHGGSATLELGSVVAAAIIGTNSHNANNKPIRFMTGMDIGTLTGGSIQMEIKNNAVNIFNDLDVDGHTNLDNVSIAGVSTTTGISNHSSRIQMLAGNAVRFLNNANSASTEIKCDGGARLNITSYNQTMATFENGQAIIFYTDSGQNRLQINNNGNVFIAKDLDVNGHTNLDNVSISGITTFAQSAGAVTVPSGGDIRIANSGGWTGEHGGKIQHYLNFLYIQGGTSGIRLRHSDGNDRWVIDSNGHFVAGSDSTYDIGTTGVRVRNGYFDTLYGDGSNLTGISGVTINNNADNRIITGSGTANTLEGESTLIFGGGTLTNSSNQDEAIVLSGSPNPYIRFRDASGTNKGYIQMHGNGNMYLVNQVTSESLKIGSGAGGLTFTHDGTERIVAHSGYLTNSIWYTEGQPSFVGNWGQFENHGTYTDMNTEPAYWGWNYVTGNTNAPNTNSSQWYRGRFSLGNGYGKGTDSGDYWMEITVPRTLSQAGQMWVRTCENGNEGSWQEVGSVPRTSIIPYQNNSIDLGSASSRFSNVYTTDLQLSNKGKTNDVDGTWGDWTLQEGEDKIFMINNRTGKKYSLKMEEE